MAALYNARTQHARTFRIFRIASCPWVRPTAMSKVRQAGIYLPPISVALRAKKVFQRQPLERSMFRCPNATFRVHVQ